MPLSLGDPYCRAVAVDELATGAGAMRRVVRDVVIWPMVSGLDGRSRSG